MKSILEDSACFAIGITLAFALMHVFDANRERRFVLYHIRNELEIGMSKTRVEDILERHQTSFIHKYESEKGIGLRVDVGIANSYFLSMAFSEGSLKRAEFSTEDGPYHPKDAPPNLE